MNGKRLLILFLALGLAFTMASCSPKEERVTIGLCVDNAQDPWTARFLKTLEPRLAEMGYTVKLRDGGGDQSAQNAQVAELIDGEIDGLVLIPCMSTGVEVALQKLRDAGVPSVLCRREISTDVLENNPGVAWVGVDRADVGRAQADVLRQSGTNGDRNGDGAVSYLLLQLPADHVNAALRTEGVLDSLRLTGLQTKELAAQCADADPDKAQGVCDSLMRQFGPDVEVIISNDDSMALGAAEAILEAGGIIGQDLYIVGADGSRKGLEAVKLGWLTGTVVEDVAGQAETAAQILHKLLTGVAVQQIHEVPHIPVTRENVDTYLAEGV